MFQEAVLENKNFEVTFASTIKGFFVALKPPVRGAVFVFLKSIWNGYYKIQFYRKVKLHYVSLPVDERIVFYPQALSDYYSFIPAWLSLLYYIYSEFGNGTLNDIRQFILDVSNAYTESGKIFTAAQTTCKRAGNGGVFIRLLRLIDQERNLAPSLHVEVAAFIYIRGVGLLEKYARDGKDYSGTKQELFNRGVRIMESTLLIKQHCVRDVSLGLFMVSALDSGFSETEAVRMAESMFAAANYGMSEHTVKEVRALIKDIYRIVRGSYIPGRSEPSTVAINYIKNL